MRNRAELSSDSSRCLWRVADGTCSWLWRLYPASRAEVSGQVMSLVSWFCCRAETDAAVAANDGDGGDDDNDSDGVYGDATES